MKGKKSMVIVSAVILFLAVVLVVYYFGAFYPKFNSLDKKQEFMIPGLSEEFVPQGLDYVQTNQQFLVSGYMSSGEPSRIYVIDKSSGKEQKYVTVKVKGEDYKGHAGGVAVDGSFVWIVGDKQLVTLALGDIKNAKNGESVNALSVIETGNGCDFVETYGEYLFIGEFYKKGDYETPSAHHITHENGEQSHAVGYFYKINPSETSGIDKKPTKALTLPDKAQGIAFYENKIIISSSWSIGDSKILVYDNPLTDNASKTITHNNEDVPLYSLNSTLLVNKVKAPAMSEEITVVGDRIFILFESACKKYRIANRTRTKQVISIKI